MTVFASAMVLLGTAGAFNAPSVYVDLQTNRAVSRLTPSSAIIKSVETRHQDGEQVFRVEMKAKPLRGSRDPQVLEIQIRDERSIVALAAIVLNGSVEITKVGELGARQGVVIYPSGVATRFEAQIYGSTVTFRHASNAEVYDWWVISRFRPENLPETWHPHSVWFSVASMKHQRRLGQVRLISANGFAEQFLVPQVPKP